MAAAVRPNAAKSLMASVLFSYTKPPSAVELYHLRIIADLTYESNLAGGTILGVYCRDHPYCCRDPPPTIILSCQLH